MDIEKIADDRYRLRAHNQVITLTSQDLLDIFDYLREGARIDNLKLEARAAVRLLAREKPWLPIQPNEEF